MSTAQSRKLLVLSFESRLFAQEALLAATRLEGEGKILVHDAVFVTRHPSGDGSVVEETRDPDAVESAFGGGFWGLLFGTLLAGPVGAIVGAAGGAGAGALAAALIDYGVRDETVKKLRDHLAPGRTALALLVSHLDEAAVVEELHRFQGAELVQSDFTPHLEDALREALALHPASEGNASTTPPTDASTTMPSPTTPQEQLANEVTAPLPISQFAR